MTPPAGAAAGVHLPWAGVPVAVRAWAAEVGGGEPAAVRDVPGGFSPGAATVLGCPRGSIFVKAVGSGLNPDSPDLHRREAVFSASMPVAPQFPRLLDVYDDGDWVALAFEAIHGRPPAHPWQRSELAAAVRALRELHETLTPNPVAAALPATDRLSGTFGGWAALATMARPPAGLDAWSRANLGRLAALESAWRDAVVGPTLLHCDVRSDNLLVTETGVVFVDWPHACVGAPVLDLVVWAPSVELEGGPAPEDLLALYAPAPTVDREVVAALVAAFSGYLVPHSLQPAPRGLPTLRSFQGAQGAVALAWLRRLVDW